MKAPVRQRRAESGQAILLVILGMSTFLLGAVGLAVDGAHLYAQRQMAQTAADAAAQAGIMSIFDGSDISGSAHYFSPTTGVHTCGTSDPGTPCFYAQNLNGFNGTGDTVTYEPNPGISVPGLSSDPVNLLRVTVQRSVPTTLLRLLGPTASTIKATGTAAIVDVMSPVPILVLHPTLDAAFSKNGTNNIVICGGPTLSIQVNSDGSLSQQGNSVSPAVSISGNSGTINLSQAGPLDSGNCDTGTGANFGSHGGPPSSNPPTGLLLGTEPGQYIDPASPIKDPLSGLQPPPKPPDAPSYVKYSAGQHGCPTDLPSGAECRVYSPGYYDTGINISSSGGGVFALFRPGIYYINHGGFKLGSNTVARMAVSPDNVDLTTGTSWTQGMLVYNSPQGTVNANQDIISFASNTGKMGSLTFNDATQCGTDSAGNALGGNCLVGANGGALTASLCSSDASLQSSYYGILFFQDHATAAQLTHTLQGSGGLSLKGTTYLTTQSGSGSSNYQALNLNGNSGSTTKVQGEIITDTLSLGGGSTIQMNLSGLACYKVRQVALVQ